MEDQKRPLEVDPGEEEEAGPPRPPAEDEEEPDVGPALPKAKKRKVWCVWAPPTLHFKAPTPAAVLQREPRATAGARVPCAPPSKEGPPPPCGGPAPPSPQVLPVEQQYLDALPCAQMYERSYMHRETLTHIVVRRPAGALVRLAVQSWPPAAQAGCPPPPSTHR